MLFLHVRSNETDAMTYVAMSAYVYNIYSPHGDGVSQRRRHLALVVALPMVASLLLRERREANVAVQRTRRAERGARVLTAVLCVYVYVCECVRCAVSSW
jgi:hypothetical protein